MTTNNELHVIFGTGPLGKWTAHALTQMGKRVRMVNRSGKAERLPAGVEVVKGDAYDAAWTRDITAGAAAVYQCAQPHYYEWPTKFMPLQESIMAGAAAAGAKLIAAENVYMYGDTKGQPMTENTPYNAHTRKGKVRQAMTEALFAAHSSGKVRVAVARGSDFFGPEDPIYTELVFIPALKGKAVNLIGRADMPHTFTYAPDFGRLLATLGTRDEALGQAWHVPSNAPVTQAALVQLIAAEIGQPVKTMMGTAPILWLMGLFNKNVGEMVEMLYEFNQPFIVDSSKAERALGLKATPLAEMVRATLAFARGQEAVAAGH
ncbi:MAG: NAD-dependent epimerase/dehydratase family protein [Chloroflexi bacterium]|nr:NAD-dependent epimerase/dehydratase family protein [Chloroflexota bacterium]